MEQKIKICNKCKEEKPLSEFYKMKTGKFGVKGRCKICEKEIDRIWRKNNIERERERSKKYNKSNPDKVKNNQLKRNYNITLKEYNEMFEHQEGKCFICNIHQSEFKKLLSVDHNHETGKVRGLLCDGCNSILGRANDNITILENAIKYIKKYR